MKRIEDCALIVGQMGRATSGFPIPEWQAARSNHPAIEVEPGLKLKHRVDQEPGVWLIVPGGVTAKAGRDEEHVGRAQNFAANERLVEKSGDAGGQDYAECEYFAA